MGMEDLTRWLDRLVTWALELGPSGRFVLPIAGATLGLVALVLAWVVLAQRTAWRLRELRAALRTAVHAEEDGARVLLVGRLRAPTGETIASFEREGRRAVVSSLHRRARRVIEHVATRAAPGLILETREGPVPIAGSIDVRRTRAAKAARNVDAATRAGVRGDADLRASDLVEGQWVLAEGVLGRITREGLREQAGVRGLSGAERAPIVLGALRPEVPPWTFRIGFVGALVAGLLVTPLPWPTPLLVEITNRPAWDVLTAMRLLGPTRDAALSSFAGPEDDASLRAWRALAAREQGRCGEAAALFAALRRDEEALALLGRPGCSIEPARELQLLRESGYIEGASEVLPRAVVTNRTRLAIAMESGRPPEPLVDDEAPVFAALPAPSELACDVSCLRAIAGSGDGAFEIVATRRPAGALAACGGEVTSALDELGLSCPVLSPARAVEALRVAPRPVLFEPLSRIEVRLHVHRLLLEAAGEREAARAIEARQRRLLAILATPGGASAEELWTRPRAPAIGAPFYGGPLYDPEPWDGESVPRFMPATGSTPEEQVEALLRAP